MSKKLLSKLYYDPEEGFISQNKLYKKAKLINPKITHKDVKEFFKNNEVVQIHTIKKKTKEKLPIIGVIGHFQADLTFLTNFKRQNNGYHILLTAIEVNSRKGYAIPLKKKTQSAILEAIKELVKQANNIKVLQTDNGNEFTNKAVSSFLKKQSIKQEFCQSEDKACLGKGERFNKTIKGMLNKYMTANNTTKWIDVLPKIVKNYNNTEHDTIKKAPIKVSLDDEKIILGDAIDKIVNSSKSNIEVGDKVRLPLKRNMFSKEGKRFSSEVYIVSKINKKTLLVENKTERYKIDDVLKISQNSKSINQTNIKNANKKARIDRRLNKENVKEKNIKKKSKRMTALNSSAINKLLVN